MKIYLNPIPNNNYEYKNYNSRPSFCARNLSSAQIALREKLMKEGITKNFIYFDDFLIDKTPKGDKLNNFAFDLFQNLIKIRCEGHFVAPEMAAVARAVVGENQPASEKVVDWVKKNIEDDDLLAKIRCCIKKDLSEIDEQKLQAWNYLETIPSTYFTRADILRHPYFDNNNPIEALKKFPEEEMFYILQILDFTTEKQESVDWFVNLKTKVSDFVKKQGWLYRNGIGNIYDLFLGYGFNYGYIDTVKVINLIGEEPFIRLFKDDYYQTGANLKFLAQSLPDDKKEVLLKIINPKSGQRYKDLEKEIKELKSSFSDANIDKDELFKKINTATKEKNNLVSSSLKDPKEIIEDAFMFITLNQKAPDELKKIEPLLTQSNYKENRLKIWNSVYLKTLDVEITKPQIKEFFDFSDNKYLPILFQANNQFKQNMQVLIKTMEKTPGKTSAEIFDNLIQNFITKNSFNLLGINYEKWSKKNPDLFLEVDLKNEKIDIRKNLIKNIEADFNTMAFNKLPQEEREFLLNEIKKSGIKIIKKAGKNIHGKIGFVSKNFETLSINELKSLLKTIASVFSSGKFWEAKTNDIELNSLIADFKYHILRFRMPELKEAEKECESLPSKIIIQKADMNDISHALFLGNHSACCTSVNGCNSWSAPMYLMNKAIQAIEIKAGNNYIGNTMCFLAYVDGQISLILDNFELKSNFQYNSKITQGVIDFAKNLCSEIGLPNIPIYAGAERQKLHFNGEIIPCCNINFIGSTAEQPVYIDMFEEAKKMDENENHSAKLIKILT